ARGREGERQDRYRLSWTISGRGDRGRASPRASARRRVVDRDRLLVAASRGGVRREPHSDRPHQRVGPDLEERARTGRGGVGRLAEVIPVPAASVIVLRDAAPSFEVLMIRRHESASFVPNVWVFPGGMVEQLDREIARERG